MRRLLALAVLLAPAIAIAQVRIVIDPGHGGTDPGGVGTGLQEKNIVLDVSKRFESLLKADTADEGGGGRWTALLTRTNDTFVSLAGRSAYSNNQNADRFMSIHANAFGDPSANGIETFSLSTTGTGAQLRNLVQAEMVAAWGLTNRGNKTANFAVLRDTAAPAVLHELAFITNSTDASKLGSPAEREKAAVAHLRAIQRHYNLAPYLPTSTPVADTGEIAGRVVSVDGPLVGATVAVAGGTTVVTDGDGMFVVTQAAVGGHILTASAQGYLTRTVDVTVAASVRAEIEIELVPEPDDGERPTIDGVTTGGCSTGRGTGLGLLFVLLAAGLRKRRRA